MKNITDYWTEEKYVNFRDIIFSILLEDMNKCDLNLAEAELNLIHKLNDVIYDYETALMNRNENY